MKSWLKEFADDAFLGLVAVLVLACVLASFLGGLSLLEHRHFIIGTIVIVPGTVCILSYIGEKIK